MEIRIYYLGKCQYKKLADGTTEEKAKSILRQLYENDYLGCESFELVDDEENVICCFS
jgi:hypothetical protein